MMQYYEPEVVDAPKDVDFQGIVNTLEAVKKSADLQARRQRGGRQRGPRKGGGGLPVSE